jgi:hypothetical protein
VVAIAAFIAIEMRKSVVVSCGCGDADRPVWEGSGGASKSGCVPPAVTSPAGALFRDMSNFTNHLGK